MPVEASVVVKVRPESDVYCGNCHLLRGINVASCLAGFSPVFSGRVTLRPKECVEMACTLAALKQHMSTWSTLP